MKSYRDQIHEYIQLHRTDIIEELKTLSTIPSVKGISSEGMPQGKAVAEALEFTRALYQTYGFEAELDETGYFLLSHYGKKEESQKSIGLFAHADVVSPADGWIYTEPFVPVEKEGFLIGRGVCDDKAGILISLYCARILRELAIPFSSRLEMFTGGSEETGMQDIKIYCKKHRIPDFSFVCDTAFPLYRGGKGRLVITADADKPLKDIKDFYGGMSANIVLGEAVVRLGYEERLYNELKEKATEQIEISVENEEIVICSKGISSHAALPEGSVNAGYLAADLLSNCVFIHESDRRQLVHVAEMLKGFYGEPFRIESEDNEFGKLTCANGIVRMKDNRLSLTFDIRMGIDADRIAVKNKIKRCMHEYGFQMQINDESVPWVVKKDEPMIDVLLQVYREISGDITAETRLNAGGTYAKHLSNAVEIGTQIWKDIPFQMPRGHGGVHQPDECISIEGLLEALEITVAMLIACDRQLNS